MEIKNCTFQFECPRKWESLKLTNQDGTRHCSQCNRDVYLCSTDEELIAHAKADHCVAIFREQMTLGQPMPEYAVVPNSPLFRRKTKT